MNLKEMRRIIAREPEIAPGEFDPATLPQLLRKENRVILDIGCNNRPPHAFISFPFKMREWFSLARSRAQERSKKKVPIRGEII